MSRHDGATDGGDEAPSKAALESEIAQTRADLAETVDELAARLDVKTRAKERLQQTGEQVTRTVADRAGAIRDQVTDTSGRLTPIALTAGGATVVLVAAVAFVLWRRSR